MRLSKSEASLDTKQPLAGGHIGLGAAFSVRGLDSESGADHKPEQSSVRRARCQQRR